MSVRPRNRTQLWVFHCVSRKRLKSCSVLRESWFHSRPHAPVLWSSHSSGSQRGMNTGLLRSRWCRMSARAWQAGGDIFNVNLLSQGGERSECIIYVWVRLFKLREKRLLMLVNIIYVTYPTHFQLFISVVGLHYSSFVWFSLLWALLHSFSLTSVWNKLL